MTDPKSSTSVLYIEHGRQPPHPLPRFRPRLQHQEKAHDVVTQPFGKTNVSLFAALQESMQTQYVRRNSDLNSLLSSGEVASQMFTSGGHCCLCF